MEPGAQCVYCVFLEIDSFAVQGQGILRTQGEDVNILRLTLGNEIDQHQLGTVGVVSEGDLLNALILQIAQSTEGAGKNGTLPSRWSTR